MRHKYTLTFSLSILFGTALFGIAHGATNNVTYVKIESNDAVLEESDVDISPTSEVDRESTRTAESDNDSPSTEDEVATKQKQALESSDKTIHTVPFYSQFTDISAPEWRKIGCGIASLAMLIDFYKPGEISVDALLNEGIKTGAYIKDSGWSHAGLIELGKDHGLSGEAVYMNDLSMSTAFSKLEEVLKVGPVMVSVHYTFTPTNPIPHLVVVTGVEDGKVYYNDPAEESGGGTVSIEKFQSAWKKRFIAIRP